MNYGLILLLGNAFLTTVISAIWVGRILIKEYRPVLKRELPQECAQDSRE